MGTPRSYAPAPGAAEPDYRRPSGSQTESTFNGSLTQRTQCPGCCTFHACKNSTEYTNSPGQNACAAARGRSIVPVPPQPAQKACRRAGGTTIRRLLRCKSACNGPAASSESLPLRQTSRGGQAQARSILYGLY